MAISEFLSASNSLLEDSSVLIVVAYLLSRGKTLPLLFPDRPRTWREIVLLGVVIGCFGATEYLWPGLRFPYSTPTLFVAFATLIGGATVGGTTTLVLAFASLLSPHTALPSLLAIVASFVCALPFRLKTESPMIAIAAGALTQLAALCTHLAFARVSVFGGIASVAANGIGLSLLLLVTREARVRAQVEQLRLQAERLRTEAEQARALSVQHQLDALRSRLHPHFLFNTLTAIAALCGTSPKKAEAATIRLGELMRRVLDSDTSAVTLAEEIAAVTGYLDIERLRLSHRLGIRWNTESGLEGTELPRFSLLTLVENAVLHGISREVRGGMVTITLRQRNGALLVAVQDNGAGMPLEKRRAALASTGDRLHGLMILDRQLRLQYGDRARIRLFTSSMRGTLVAFSLMRKIGLDGN